MSAKFTERAWRVVLAFLLAPLILMLASCANSPSATMGAPGVPVGTPGNVVSDAGNLDSIYQLGSGDKIRITVFGENDLSGVFDVNGAGMVSMPLVGPVSAKGKTIDQFADIVTDKLKGGYLTDPKVSIEVINYRPFYIIGEVEKPGQYPYTNGMTVLNAVAVAGGFTYRASADSVYIARGGAGEVEMPVGQMTRVLPGDVVRIPERYF